MENERARVLLIQEAVLAALGCTKIDYRSPRQMDEAAGQIAAFVEDALTRAADAKAKCVQNFAAAASNWPPQDIGTAAQGKIT